MQSDISDRESWDQKRKNGVFKGLHIWGTLNLNGGKLKSFFGILYLYVEYDDC